MSNSSVFSIKNNSDDVLSVFIEPWGDEVKIKKAEEAIFFSKGGENSGNSFLYMKNGLVYMALPGSMVEVHVNGVRLNTISSCIEAS